MEESLPSAQSPLVSSIAVFRDGVEFSAQSLAPLIRASWPILVPLQIIELVSDQYFDYVSEIIQRRGSENLLLLGGTAFLEFLTGLIFMAAWFLAVIPTLQALEDKRGRLEANEIPHLGRSFRIHLNQLLIEQTRVFAAVLWRLPFLILLSPLEYIRLSMVPYIVVLEPSYAEGKIDALQASRELARGRWLLLAGLALLTSLVPILIKQFVVGGGNIWIWESPARTLIHTCLQFLMNLLTSMIFFSVFKSLRGRFHRGAAARVTPLESLPSSPST